MVYYGVSCKNIMIKHLISFFFMQVKSIDQIFDAKIVEIIDGHLMNRYNVYSHTMHYFKKFCHCEKNDNDENDMKGFATFCNMKSVNNNYICNKHVSEYTDIDQDEIINLIKESINAKFDDSIRYVQYSVNKARDAFTSKKKIIIVNKMLNGIFTRSVVLATNKYKSFFEVTVKKFEEIDREKCLFSENEWKDYVKTKNDLTELYDVINKKDNMLLKKQECNDILSEEICGDIIKVNMVNTSFILNV